MNLHRLKLPEVIEIVPRRFSDERGVFTETWNQERFATGGINFAWTQDNQSFSTATFTLRGLHYQTPPFAQDKLVRVLKGRILDIAVDIRADSPTFGRWVGLEISAAAFNQVLVPKGFAHGFLTLEPDTDVFYKVSAPYSSLHERGILWSDPAIGIHWPLGDAKPVLSRKDAAAPLLSEVERVFRFEGDGA